MSDAIDAARYRYLRERDLDTIDRGGVFAGMTPKNVVLNGDDLDRAVDLAMEIEHYVDPAGADFIARRVERMGVDHG